MVSLPQKTKFDPKFAIADRDGNPTQLFRDYLVKIDALVSAIASGIAPPLINAANDGAAAAAGVQIGQEYRNGNAIQVRLV